MIGGESESGGDDDTVKAGRASLEEAEALKRALAKQGHWQTAAACSVPAAHLSSPPLNFSAEAAAWRDRKQEHPGISGRHKLRAAAPYTREDASAGSSAGDSCRDEEMEPTQKGQKGIGRAEGHSGVKQKRSKKAKPQSQLQLMQVQVQAKKASKSKVLPVLKHERLADSKHQQWHHRDGLNY